MPAAMLADMTGRGRREDRAIHRSRELYLAASREIQLARESAGLSQDAAGLACGMSGSQFGRIERGELRHVTLEQLCRASAAVGLRPGLRLYPDDDPVRDAAHLRLLSRFRDRVPTGVGWRTEVPLRRIGDLRSWDAQLQFDAGPDGVEAETRVHDAQATWRRIGGKLRDDPTVQHVILLVADTTANRRAVAMARELLRVDLPLDTRAVLGALAAGRSAGANGIVFL